MLLLDVARFKYPPHWVSLELLHRAMTLHDRATSKPRGWVLLRPAPAGCCHSRCERTPGTATPTPDLLVFRGLSGCGWRSSARENTET